MIDKTVNCLQFLRWIMVASTSNSSVIRKNLIVGGIVCRV